jgi:hypothetical protein
VDVRQRQHPLAHLGQVEALRCGFQEHVDGLAQQLQGARDDEDPDDQGRDRVGAQPAEGGDEGGCDQDRDRAEGVVEHFEECGSHVQVRASSTGQHEQADDVADQPDDTEHDHHAGGHFGWGDEPPDRLDHDERADGEQDGGLGGGGEDLGAPVAPGPFVGGGSAGERRGDDGHGEPGDVGEHVAGIGEQRQAAGEVRADDFDDQHGDGDAEHDEQSVAVVCEFGGPVVVVSTHQA